MASAADPLQIALSHHQAGRLREAEAIYRQILSHNPHHADALHLLGLLAYQAGRPELAFEPLERAVALSPGRAVFLANLGEVYRALGRWQDADRTITRALELDPLLPDAHNSLGAVERSLGHLDRAAVHFRAAIKLRGEFAEAHNNLGAVLHAQGNTTAAIQAFERALECRPDYVSTLNNLGSVWQELGRHDEAAICFRRAQQVAPDEADAWMNLGNLEQAEGQTEAAITCYREALRIEPRSVLALHNLAVALEKQGAGEESLACFQQAISLEPRSADRHFYLATAFHARQDWARAEAAYREALRLDPAHVKSLANLGSVLQHQGRLDESLAVLNRALELDPTLAQAHLNRANLYKAQKRYVEARMGYERAVELRPDFAEAYNNLAVLFTDTDDPDASIRCCRKGLEFQPESASLYANLSTALQNLAEADEAIACGRKAVELRPDGVGEHTNLLYKLNFHPGYTQAQIFEEHLEWARRHAEPLTRQAHPHTNDRSPQRRLRVGYVSPYFRDHAVNFFSEPLITAHQHPDFEIVCYSDVHFEDDATRRLRTAVDEWRDVGRLTDDALAVQIREDRIDILVDLTGHIAGNRLLTFARKPAPVQVTYLGYQNTTGMSAMDYRLSDAWADPPGWTDEYHTEKLVRLPRAFFCYRPDDVSPQVGPLPALGSGRVTFGAFNNFAKASAAAVEAWLDILAQTPNSRLLLLARGGGRIEDRLSRMAGERGVDPARIEYCTKRPRPAYLELVRQADIALDPFPFNGHTTTCDAIWMGVPVVMLAGQSYATRFGGSVLLNVGLEHFIADSPAAYVEAAVRLASNLSELAELRESLRPTMQASPLLDATGFTRNLEAAYRNMWRAWCERPVDSDAKGTDA
jgi:predicted O-linked N-acetylglucosamine transferase (SPINDLY family)